MRRLVRFPVAPEVAFDYLADPRHRAEWQSSLRGVDDVSEPAGGPIEVGLTWTDVTVPGLRPRMELTRLERPHAWAERGTWRGFSAVLTLTFVAVGSGRCDVGVEMNLCGRGVAAVVAPLLGRVAPWAVRADLRRAAGILAGR